MKNLLKTMTIEELELEAIEQENHPKRVEIIQKEIAGRYNSCANCHKRIDHDDYELGNGLCSSCIQKAYTPKKKG